MSNLISNGASLFFYAEMKGFSASFPGSCISLFWVKDTENEVKGFHGSPHGHSRLRSSQIKFQSLASLYLSHNSKQNSIKKKIAIYSWSLSRIMVATYYGGIGQSYYRVDISIQYNACSDWISIRTQRLFKSKLRQNKYRGYKRGLSSHSKPARAKNRPVI